MQRLRDILLGGVSGLAIGAAVIAQAQNITSSLQVSQDPRSPIGLDASNNMYLLRGQHLLSNTNAGGKAPTISSCGTGPTIAGTDFVFNFATGTAGTVCTISFGTAFGAAPQCLILPQAAATVPTYTATATQIAITTSIATTSYVGVCLGSL